MQNKWNIDREPTRKERALAISFGVVACLLTGFISIGGILMSLKENKDLMGFSFFYVLFLLSIWVLVRAIFSRSAKPSVSAIMATGIFLVIAGIALLVIASHNNSYSLFYVFGSIFGGITIFIQGYRKLQKP